MEYKPLPVRRQSLMPTIVACLSAGAIGGFIAGTMIFGSDSQTDWKSALAATDAGTEAEAVRTARTYVQRLLRNAVDPFFEEEMTFWDAPTQQWAIVGKVRLASNLPGVGQDGTSLKLHEKSHRYPYRVITFVDTEGEWRLRHAAVGQTHSYYNSVTPPPSKEHARTTARERDNVWTLSVLRRMERSPEGAASTAADLRQQLAGAQRGLEQTESRIDAARRRRDMETVNNLQGQLEYRREKVQRLSEELRNVGRK